MVSDLYLEIRIKEKLVLKNFYLRKDMKMLLKVKKIVLIPLDKVSIRISL